MIASSDLAVCESKLGRLTAAHRRLQDQLDSPVASLEQQLDDLREQSFLSERGWTEQIGELTKTNWVLREKEEAMRARADVAERTSAQKITELNQMCIVLRAQAATEEVQAEIVSSPAAVLGSTPPPSLSPISDRGTPSSSSSRDGVICPGGGRHQRIGSNRGRGWCV